MRKSYNIEYNAETFMKSITNSRTNIFIYLIIFFYDDCTTCVLNSIAKHRNKIDIESLKYDKFVYLLIRKEIWGHRILLKYHFRTVRDLVTVGLYCTVHCKEGGEEIPAWR